MKEAARVVEAALESQTHTKAVDLADATKRNPRPGLTPSAQGTICDIPSKAVEVLHPGPKVNILPPVDQSRGRANPSGSGMETLLVLSTRRALGP